MPTYREIPKGSIKIKKGLWMKSSLNLGNKSNFLKREVYAEQGYCFYIDDLEIKDKNGKLYPRIYYVYFKLSKIDNIKSLHVVKYQEGMEIIY